MERERGATVWLTGLPCSGKSSVAELVAGQLRQRGRRVEVLDGDAVRTFLSAGLGFTKADRDTNVRRIGFVAELLTRHGVFAIVAAISPYAETRSEVRARIGAFVEVFVACPLWECERRDVKGLYAQARAGQLQNFTGVSDPYEPPSAPELVLNTAEQTPEESAARVLQRLAELGYRLG